MRRIGVRFTVVKMLSNAPETPTPAGLRFRTMMRIFVALAMVSAVLVGVGQSGPGAVASQADPLRFPDPNDYLLVDNSPPLAYLGLGGNQAWWASMSPDAAAGALFGLQDLQRFLNAGGTKAEYFSSLYTMTPYPSGAAQNASAFGDLGSARPVDGATGYLDDVSGNTEVVAAVVDTAGVIRVVGPMRQGFQRSIVLDTLPGFKSEQLRGVEVVRGVSATSTTVIVATQSKLQYFVVGFDANGDLQLQSQGDLDPEDNNGSFLAMSHSPAWANEFNSLGFPTDQAFFVAESTNVTSSSLARPRIYAYAIGSNGVPVVVEHLTTSADGRSEMRFDRGDVSNGHLFDLQVDVVASGGVNAGFYVGYRGPSDALGTTRGFVGRKGDGLLFNWGNEDYDCQGDMDFVAYQSRSGSADRDLNDTIWTMVCAQPNPDDAAQVRVNRVSAVGGVNANDVTIRDVRSVFSGDDSGSPVIDPQIQLDFPCLELFRSTGMYRADAFIGTSCPNAQIDFDPGADAETRSDDVVTINNPGDPTITLVAGLADDSSDTHRHDTTRATINHMLWRIDASGVEQGLRNQWTPQLTPELQGMSATTLIPLPYDRIVTRVDLDPLYDGCVSNANTTCEPPISTDGAIPLAVLTAPPQVANANQTTFDPPIYATAQSAGGGTSTSVGGSAGFSVGVKTGLSIPGLAESEIEVLTGYDWSFSASTGRSVEVSQSQAFTGLEDADSVVFQSQTSYVYSGVILESSNGLANGSEIGFVDPISVNRNVTSWENLQNIEPSQFGPGGVFYDSIEAILSHDVGDPGSYPEYGANGSALDDRCLGNVAGTKDEFAALGTYRSAQQNAFTVADEYPTPQDAILVTEPFRTIAGSTNGEGAEIEVAQSTERTYNIEHEFNFEVNLSAGSTAVAFLGSVNGGVTFGGESTYELGDSTAFSASVGHFPDPDLSNETYGWRMYLCKQDLAANGGFAVPYPVHVLGFTVDGYAGSGGIEDLGPIVATSGIRSETMPVAPSLDWTHDSGTIETYEIEVEAVGRPDVRETTITYSNTVEGSANAVGGRLVDLSFEPAGLGGDLLEGQLYRWRVQATDFFGNRISSPFNFFVTEAENNGGGTTGGTTTGGSTTGGSTAGGTTTGGNSTGGTATGGTSTGGTATGGATTGGTSTGGGTGTGGSTTGGNSTGGASTGGSSAGGTTGGGVAATLPADGSLRVNVSEAIGGRTVVGQLTAVRVGGAGFLTAYACDDGIPRGADGQINKADLNMSQPGATSNRLLVPADDDGDICIYSSTEAHIITDVFGTTDDIESFPNRRSDTRKAGDPVEQGSTFAINVPEARGGKTVIGQLTVTQMSGRGFLTVFACDEGLPRDGAGRIDKSDLNFAPPGSASNRLIAPADEDGDICIYSFAETHVIADIFGVTDDFTIFDNQRTDSRLGDFGLCAPGSVPDGPRWSDANGDDVVDVGEVPCIEAADAPAGTTGQMFATHRVNVPEARGGKTVIGQLTVARPLGVGYLTAFACDEGIPRSADGDIDKSDLNHSRYIPISNRLIVPADDDGDICVYTSVDAHIVTDIFSVTDDIDIFANQRTDTRP